MTRRIEYQHLTVPTRQKPKRPTKQQYAEAAFAEAVAYAPPIHPCADCSWPVVSGYCCGYCGSVDPARDVEK